MLPNGHYTAPKRHWLHFGGPWLHAQPASASGPTTAGAQPARSALLAAECTSAGRRLLQKNGTKFERLVRAKERANPKFAFLLPSNPYHLHYRWGALHVEAAMELGMCQFAGPHMCMHCMRSL